MAITVDWTTKIVSVPKADTTFVANDPVSGREIRNHDTEAFRLQMHDAQDDPLGMGYERIFRRDAPSVLGGITFAQKIEIINGYQVEYEDGNYAVNLIGSNNNIGDVAVVNNVSIRPQNSAGLISISDVLATLVLLNTEVNGVSTDLTALTNLNNTNLDKIIKKIAPLYGGL